MVVGFSSVQLRADGILGAQCLDHKIEISKHKSHWTLASGVINLLKFPPEMGMRLRISPNLLQFGKLKKNDRQNIRKQKKEPQNHDQNQKPKSLWRIGNSNHMPSDFRTLTIARYFK